VVYSLPVRGEKSSIFAGMLLINDVTECKLAEAHEMDLRLQRERTAILHRFIQDASHEFWTPLSIMQTSLHLLDKSLERPRQKERIVTLREQVAYIERLVNDLILMSRLDSETEYQFNSTDLIPLLENLYQKWQPAATEKNLHFDRTLSSGLPPVKVDAGMLSLALGNIIENAVSFSSPGDTISLVSGQVDEKVIIQINDSRMGMNDEVMSHMFERLYRGDPVRSVRGSGLGLSIAQRVIEIHGGTIQVESKPNVGSTFTVSLPLANKD
jgi:signal transduction histidine kinase